MVYFQTTSFSEFWYLLRPFGIHTNCVANWFILWQFGIILWAFVIFYGHLVCIFPILVHCVKKNLATVVAISSVSRHDLKRKMKWFHSLGLAEACVEGVGSNPATKQLDNVRRYTMGGSVYREMKGPIQCDQTSLSKNPLRMWPNQFFVKINT
jgi:hypothetical protein